jgi:hypothetical protein
MALVYIAGPFKPKASGALGLTERAHNINAAMEAGLECATYSVPFFCPHIHSDEIDKRLDFVTADDQEFIAERRHRQRHYWLNLDEEILQYCNALLVLPGWQNSQGTRWEMELFESKNLGPIFHYPHEFQQLLRWYREYISAQSDERRKKH